MLNLQTKKLANRPEDSDIDPEEIEEINNFKGIYYNENSEQRFYEHNAHFPYKELCLKLNRLLKVLSPSRKELNKVNKVATGFRRSVDTKKPSILSNKVNILSSSKNKSNRTNTNTNNNVNNKSIEKNKQTTGDIKYGNHIKTRNARGIASNHNTLNKQTSFKSSSIGKRFNKVADSLIKKIENAENKENKESQLKKEEELKEKQIQAEKVKSKDEITDKPVELPAQAKRPNKFEITENNLNTNAIEAKIQLNNTKKSRNYSVGQVIQKPSFNVKTFGKTQSLGMKFNSTKKPTTGMTTYGLNMNKTLKPSLLKNKTQQKTFSQDKKMYNITVKKPFLLKNDKKPCKSYILTNLVNNKFSVASNGNNTTKYHSKNQSVGSVSCANGKSGFSNSLNSYRGNIMNKKSTGKDPKPVSVKQVKTNTSISTTTTKTSKPVLYSTKSSATKTNASTLNKFKKSITAIDQKTTTIKVKK